MKHETELIFDSLLPYLKSLYECAANSLDHAHNEQVAEYFRGQKDAFGVAMSWVSAYQNTLKGLEKYDRS